MMCVAATAPQLLQSHQRLLSLGGDVGGRDACRDLLVRRRALQQQLQRAQADNSAAGHRARRSVPEALRELDAESAKLSVSEGDFEAFSPLYVELVAQLNGNIRQADAVGDEPAWDAFVEMLASLEALEVTNWQIDSSADTAPTPPASSVPPAWAASSGQSQASPPPTPTSASKTLRLQSSIDDGFVSSGNSHIVDAFYVTGQGGFKQSHPAKVKFSADLLALQRELSCLLTLNESSHSREHCIGLLHPGLLSAEDMDFQEHDPFPRSFPRREAQFLSLYRGLVMQQGGALNLQMYLANNRAGLDDDDLKQVALKVIKVVEAVHKCGIAWMDIKPHNFVQVQNEHGAHRWVAIDFDCARPLTSDTGRAEVLPLGYDTVTWEYASPELARETAAHERSTPQQFDMWALGVTVMEVLGGGDSFCSHYGGDVPAIKRKLAALTDAEVEEYVNSRFSGALRENRAVRDFFRSVLKVSPSSRLRARDLRSILKGDNLSGFTSLGTKIDDGNLRVLAGVDALRGELRGSANMLRTLVKGEFSVPTLLLLLPVERTSLFGRVKGVFKSKMELCFLCPVTLQRGTPYSLTVPRDWLVKAMPVLQLSLLLLQVALACVGIPPPALQAVCSVLGATAGTGAIGASSEALRALSSQLSEQCTDVARRGAVEGESLSTEYAALLRDLGNAAAGQGHGQGQGQVQQRLALVQRLVGFQEACKQSYRATYNLLRTTLEKDTVGTSDGSWKPRLTGLHFVVSERDGTSAWVSSAAMEDFNKEGKEALIL
ncbi:hypothetical protein B484DRAFT_236632 [Ochromonadaceae sp. CCMP2298]|nr:hypothetical protein B484DRAFT_236632 [Ochromonadaceae sp. CCMP2298]